MSKYLVGGAAEPCVPDGAAVPQQALHAELAAAAAVLVVGAVDAHDPDLFLLAVAVGHDGLLQLLARHPEPEAPGLPVSGRCVVRQRETKREREARIQPADQIKIQTTIKKYTARTETEHRGRKEGTTRRGANANETEKVTRTPPPPDEPFTRERFEDRGWPDRRAMSDVQQ